MDNYTKGPNVIPEETRDSIPIGGIPDNCKWMKIRPGSKVSNLVGVADKSLKDEGMVLFSGSGSALTKTIACAEIVKKK